MEYVEELRKVNIKYLVLKKIKKVFMFLNIKEWLIIYRLRKSKRLFYIKEVKEYFNDSDVFAFGTGGSISNLKDFDRLKDKNVMFVTTGPLYCYLKYGFMPNMWFVHNPPSVEVLIDEAKKLNLIDKLDFSKTFIFVPSNYSDSKDVEFSSKTFKKFRRLINDKAIYVLYEEKWKGYIPGDKNIDNYLDNSYPIIPMMGSSVENIFLPFLNFIGVKNIFFSGVDHMDTGHFWDREKLYQDIHGKSLNFQEIQSNNFILECGKIARVKCKEKGINVYRLEKKETVLKDYEYIKFNEAFKMANERITSKELK